MPKNVVSIGKKIIVLSDGTGNSAAKIFKTNVWRLYQALNLSVDKGQVARYDDGVGSSNYKLFAMLGGAVGWGLKRNVIDLYTFICRNYRPGDEIYAFGFSRGAFTARVLVKFILAQGLITDFYSDDDLNWEARRLYRDFRRERKTRLGFATFGRAVRDAFFFMVDGFAYRKSISKDTNITIRFVGVWDTVDAYGIPINELKNGIDQYIFPLALEDRGLDLRIGKACHAVGIDDQRTTFHPLLWDETSLEFWTNNVTRSTDDERLTQVLFSGVHANVGGGYPDDGMSFVTLNWMMKEAAKAGLVFKEAAIAEIEQSVQPIGRMYDSRAGFAGYYRYEPRHLDPFRDKQGAHIPRPKLHESVLVRMTLGTDIYAPLTLPTKARVVVEDSWTDIRWRRRSRQNIFSLEEYAALKDNRQGYLKIGETAVGAAVLSGIMKTDTLLKELAWDTVWWRRVAYFATVFVSLALFFSPEYPFLTNFYVFEMLTLAFDLSGTSLALRSFSQPVVNFISDSAGSTLPSMFAPWIKALRVDPSNFICLSLLLIACLLWGKLIDRRINDRSFAIFSTVWRDRRVAWFKASVSWRKTTALWSAIVFGGLFLFILYLYSKQQYCVGDLWGVCSAIAAAQTIARGTVGGCFLVVAIYSVISLIVLHGLSRSAEKNGTLIEQRGLALWFSNGVRNSPSLAQLYGWWVSGVVPAFFVAALIFSSLAIVSRAAFNWFNVTGKVCIATHEDVPLEEGNETVVVLNFSSLCQGTKVSLPVGGNYTVSLMNDDTFDERFDRLNEEDKVGYEPLKERANAGFPSYGPIAHVVGIPFRRRLGSEFFVVVARVGSTGDDEYVVDEKVTFSPYYGGELFLFLNNVVIGVPGYYGLFYSQPGLVKVRIKRGSDIP